MSENNSILLVEDDRFIAMALEIRLAAQGYDVVKAGGAAQALEACSKFNLQVVVMDINLPDGNGIDLMPLMRKMQTGVQLPSIIMTASTVAGLRESAMKNGAVGFFEKPFLSSELIEMVESQLSKSSG